MPVSSVSANSQRSKVVQEGPSDKALLDGIAWTGAVKWASQVLSWLSTIVVARLLNPEDYGLVAMAGVFLGFIAMLNEFGLGAAVVALRHLTDEQIAKMHGLACLFGIGGFTLACLASVPAGNVFKSSEVSQIMVGAGIGFVFVGMRSVPTALCERELRFKFLAFLEGGQSILTTIVTILLAVKGFGYWALIMGGVVGSAGATIVLWFVRPLRQAWPTLTALKEAIQLSTHVLVGRISWYVASSSDVFIGGRILGQAIIGAYSFSINIANVPLDKVTALASRVMPAFYSSVQNDPLALRRYLLLVTEGISLITFPIGVGIALVAEDFIPLLLGDKWKGAVAPLQILACWACLRSVVGLVMPILYVTAGSRKAMFNGMLCAATYPIAFLVGSQFGVVGLASAWVLAQPLSWVTPYHHVLNATSLSLWRYLYSLWPAFSAVVFMAACIIAVQQFVPVQGNLSLRFAVEVVGGALAYISAAFIMHRARLFELLQLMKQKTT